MSWFSLPLIIQRLWNIVHSISQHAASRSRPETQEQCVSWYWTLRESSRDEAPAPGVHIVCQAPSWNAHLLTYYSTSHCDISPSPGRMLSLFSTWPGPRPCLPGSMNTAGTRLWLVLTMALIQNTINVTMGSRLPTIWVMIKFWLENPLALLILMLQDGRYA